jgi:hypothetical protein
MDPASASRTANPPAVPVFLALSWLSVMVLMGSLGFDAFGWRVLIGLVPFTALTFLGWRRAHGSWTGTNSPEYNGMLIRLGLVLLPGWVLAAIIAATAEVWAPRRILVTSLIAILAMLGAGLAGRRAERRTG